MCPGYQRDPPQRHESLVDEHSQLQVAVFIYQRNEDSVPNLGGGKLYKMHILGEKTRKKKENTRSQRSRSPCSCTHAIAVVVVRHGVVEVLHSVVAILVANLGAQDRIHSAVVDLHVLAAVLGTAQKALGCIPRRQVCL